MKEVVALAASLMFIVTGAIVGARMLLVARRTQQSAELFLGLALFSDRRARLPGPHREHGPRLVFEARARRRRYRVPVRGLARTPEMATLSRLAVGVSGTVCSAVIYPGLPAAQELPRLGARLEQEPCVALARHVDEALRISLMFLNP